MKEEIFYEVYDEGKRPQEEFRLRFKTLKEAVKAAKKLKKDTILWVRVTTHSITVNNHQK